MAIIDADFMMNMPKGLTSASGIDALTHALEAYASVMATPYTDGQALVAAKTIFEYLPRSLRERARATPSPAKMMGDASTMAVSLRERLPRVCHPWRISWAPSITCRTAWRTH